MPQIRYDYEVSMHGLEGGPTPFELSAATSIHTFHYGEGDACNAHQSPDRSFDLVSNNSVISWTAGESGGIRLPGADTVSVVPDRGPHRPAVLLALSGMVPIMGLAKVAEETSPLVHGVSQQPESARVNGWPMR